MIICPRCRASHADDAAPCETCGFAPAVVDGFSAWAPDMAHEGGGFRAESFEKLASFEAQSFWFQGRNMLILWMLRRYFLGFTSLLEVGCGTGFVLSGVSGAFPHVRLVGSEIFTAGLSFAASRVPSAQLVQMDARRLPYADEFDVVAALDVIEHIEEDTTVLANLSRAVKPGGGVIISVPQHPWLWSATDEYACHVRRYAIGELERKMESAGLEILRTTSFVSLLLPAMLLSRRKSGSTASFDPGREFDISPSLNTGLGAIMALERAAIRMGMSFPVGGSRLVVARRMS